MRSSFVMEPHPSPGHPFCGARFRGRMCEPAYHPGYPHPVRTHRVVVGTSPFSRERGRSAPYRHCGPGGHGKWAGCREGTDRRGCRWFGANRDARRETGVIMQLATITVSLPEWTPSEAVRNLAEFGYDGIEWRVADDPPRA